MKKLALLTGLLIVTSSIFASTFKVVTKKTFEKNQYLFVLIENDDPAVRWQKMSQFVYNTTKKAIEQEKMEQVILMFYTKDSVIPMKINSKKHCESIILKSLTYEPLGIYLIGYAEATGQPTKEIKQYPVREFLSNF